MWSRVVRSSTVGSPRPRPRLLAGFSPLAGIYLRHGDGVTLVKEVPVVFCRNPARHQLVDAPGDSQVVLLAHWVTSIPAPVRHARQPRHDPQQPSAVGATHLPADARV